MKYSVACVLLLFVAVESFSSSRSSSTSRLVMQDQKLVFNRKLASKAAGLLLASASLFSFNQSPAYADRPLNAPSAAGTRVNSDPESLLRYGLPIDNTEIRDIQASIENVKVNLKTRRISFARGDVSNAKERMKKYGDKIMKAVPANHKEAAATAFAKMDADIPPLLESIAAEEGAGAGSVQQRASLDLSFKYQDELAKDLTVFEELMVPDTYKRTIPDEYKALGLPVLEKRATVNMVIKKPDGSKFNIDGVLFDEVKLNMVIDGYNAPISGGNFVDLVDKGFYTNMKIQRADGFVTQTGDANPDGKVHGYAPAGGKERKVPLEIAVKGDKELLYAATTEDDMRGYAATVLPFQAYGALGQAREEFDVESASSQFFWLLFESDLTPAGKNLLYGRYSLSLIPYLIYLPYVLYLILFLIPPAGKNLLDGRYSSFGYTIEGAELLKDVREGDVIASAKVVKGIENLQR